MRWLNRLTVSTPLPDFRVTAHPISGRNHFILGETRKYHDKDA
jgi:hypothetical protein